MNYYRIFSDGAERGPYTLEQLRSMWSSGQLTADCLYWQEGMADWEPVENLGLDWTIQPAEPALILPQARPIPQSSSHHVHHTGRVTTKSNGSGTVAIGSVLCFVGIILAFTPAAPFGGLLLLLGFFVAVVGRLIG